MSKMYRSAKGDVHSEQYWRRWLDDFWRQISITNCRDYTITRPADSWERMVKVLGLREI